MRSGVFVFFLNLKGMKYLKVKILNEREKIYLKLLIDREIFDVKFRLEVYIFILVFKILLNGGRYRRWNEIS